MNAQHATPEQWNKLIRAIEYHESKGNEHARSKNGTYAGVLQISTLCVDGANKIVGHKKYTYNDRLSREKSYEIFNVIQNKYNPKHDMCLAVRLWGAGIVALKNKNVGMKAYKEIMDIYNKL